MLEKLFKITENRSSVRTEMLAGLTTFMTMAYILAVNPGILSASGMPKGGVFIATALAAALGSTLMALFSNYPFVLAPGLGLNAFFSYTVVITMGYSWQFALLAVFVEGLVFLALSLTSVRESLFNAIPLSLKSAVAVGIGLFVTFIAFQGAKIVVNSDATLVTVINFHRADFHTTGVWALLAIIGTIVTGFLVSKKIRAGILLGMFITWFLGVVAELAGIYVPDASKGFFSVVPHFGNYFGDLGKTFSEFGSIAFAIFHPSSWTHSLNGVVDASGFSLVKSLDFFVVMFAFFFVDLFDTLGTLIGVSLKGGFLDDKGKLPRISGALYADSIATSVGAVLGTSTTTTFVESAAGVAAGGKTGLTSIFAAILFIVSIVFAPIFLAIPGFATAPALVIVGFYMISSIAKIDFKDYAKAIPAFLCIVAMPLTYSISDGIMFGVISYTVLNFILGKRKDIHWIMYILTVLFVLKYALM